MIKLVRYKKLPVNPEEEPHLVYCYSLYDKAADFFNPVYTTQCEPQKELLSQKRCALNGVYPYPNDLVLYLVGIFDTNVGIFREAQTLEVGSLFIGDFARKEYKQNESVQAQN